MASVAAGFFSSWTAPSKLESEWSNDLAEAQHLLRDIAIDFDDRDARFRRGADGARLTAGLRRRVDQKTRRAGYRNAKDLAARAYASARHAVCAPAQRIRGAGGTGDALPAWAVAVEDGRPRLLCP
jgi:hypothetical protein